jgi:hypothetical protein
MLNFSVELGAKQPEYDFESEIAVGSSFAKFSNL